MENNNVNDKGKIMVLISIIIAVSILLVAFVFVTVIDLTHKEAQSKISTTTRRTVETEEATDPVEEPTTEEPTTTEPTTVPTTVTPSTTKKTTAPVAVVTQKPKPTEADPGTVIPAHSYDIAYDKTTYPDALDSWEWGVVNLINQERRNNGLSEVNVARELRNMAEEGAYRYYASGASSLQPYLDGYSYLYMHSNLDIDARSLYESTKNSTKVTTDPDIKYVGVGVLVKKVSIDTYYYVIVYE